MLLLSFAKWSSASGSMFIRERVYANGWKWTPFVMLKIRYPLNKKRT